MIGLVDLLKQLEIIVEEEVEEDKAKGKKAKDENQFQGLFGLANDDEVAASRPVDCHHRALLFCQNKDYLAMIIDSILMPN